MSGVKLSEVEMRKEAKKRNEGKSDYVSSRPGGGEGETSGEAPPRCVERVVLSQVEVR